MSAAKSKKTVSLPANVAFGPLKLVDPSKLSLNPENERTYNPSSEENVALRRSIQMEGIKTPLHVYEDGTVDDGNRRLFNIQILMGEGVKIGEIPTITVPKPENEVDAIFNRLAKNEARQFSAIEQGRAFSKLRAAGIKNVDIAARTQFTPAHIGNMLTIYDSSETLRKLIEDGRLGAYLVVDTLRDHDGDETILIDAVALAAEQGKDRATQRHVDAVLAARQPAAPAVPAAAPAPAPTPVEAEVEATVETDETDETDTETPVEATVEADDAPFDADTDEVPVDADTETPVEAEATVEDDEVEEEEVTADPIPATTTKVSKSEVSALTIDMLRTLDRLVQARGGCTSEEWEEEIGSFMEDAATFITKAKAAGMKWDN